VSFLVDYLSVHINKLTVKYVSLCSKLDDRHDKAVIV